MLFSDKFGANRFFKRKQSLIDKSLFQLERISLFPVKKIFLPFKLTLMSDFQINSRKIRRELRSFHPFIVLFLVEKSLTNINCLIACLYVRRVKKHRLVTFFIRVDRRVIRVEESEYVVSFFKFLFGSIFLHKGPLFLRKIFFL